MNIYDRDHTFGRIIPAVCLASLLAASCLAADGSDPDGADVPAAAPEEAPVQGPRAEEKEAWRIVHSLEEGKKELEGVEQGVRYTARSLRNGGSARARIGLESDEAEAVFVHVVNRSEATLTYQGITLDGFGELTDEERAAVDALASSPLASALAAIPLKHGCDTVDYDPALMQALLFPWQVVLKYTEEDPAGEARAHANQSPCTYFEALDEEMSPERPPASNLLLSTDAPLPAVFGGDVLDAQGSAEVLTDIQVRSAVCGFGPKPASGNRARCRGACGADCTANNCTKTTTNVTACGETTEVTRYNCGVHQGCIDHDNCYDQCTSYGLPGWQNFECERDCDWVAFDDHGFCTAYNWGRGLGRYSHRSDFYYHDNCNDSGYECLERELEDLARTEGDPHLRTLDNLAYDFQSPGEFVLIRSTQGEAFEVQVRQELTGSERCPGSVAYNRAVAFELEGRRVMLNARHTPPLSVDGVPTHLPSGDLPLGEGAVILRTPRGDTYEVYWPSGERVSARINGSHLNLRFGVPEERKGQYEGLLGSWDDDPSNDIALPDGTVLQEPVAWETLYGTYADAWRVTEATTLFAYADGEGPESFNVPGAPNQPALAMLSDAERAEARQICSDAGITDEFLLKACVIDVGCMSDPSLTQPFTDAPAPERELEVIEPIFLDDWTQEGDPATGVWEVASDGRSVLQRSNDNPTFYVSPQEYIGVTLSGKIEVQTTADDDYVGFVFGYQSPLAANGDQPDAYDFLLLSWKQETQSFGGNLATEGLTLTRVTSTGADIEDTFWGHQAPGVQVLGTQHRPEYGWRDNVVHDFELTYFPDRLTISIDGAVVFDVFATDVGLAQFESGRFGFYNYSQESVSYSDFRVSNQRKATIFAEDFEAEMEGLNQDTFTQWDVTKGTVDVVETDWGRGVDLDGSTQSAGELTTKTPITLTAGRYELSFWTWTLSGTDEDLYIRLGDFEEQLTVRNSDGWRYYTLPIEVPMDTSAPLVFGTMSADNFGPYIDSIALRRLE